MAKLTVDQAVAEFRAILLAQLGSQPARTFAPESREEAEERYFRLAESVLGLACGDPTRCTDQRCRRTNQCRHFANLRARRQGRAGGLPSRRTPGAAALRHAIWVYMNSGCAD